MVVPSHDTPGVPAMSTAQQILVVYGVVIIAYGLVLGVPLVAARSKALHVSRHLVTAHLSAIMQGPVFAGAECPRTRGDIDVGYRPEVPVEGGQLPRARTP